MEVGAINYECYGFKLPFPVHDWPDLVPDAGWHPMDFTPASERLQAFSANFAARIDPAFEANIEFVSRFTGLANTLCLTGIAHLDAQCALGPTVAFNGNKMVPIEPIALTEGQPCRLRVSGRRGGDGGLAALEVEMLTV